MSSPRPVESEYPGPAEAALTQAVEGKPALSFGFKFWRHQRVLAGLT
jgi:hypothetical protein